MNAEFSSEGMWGSGVLALIVNWEFDGVSGQHHVTDTLPTSRTPPPLSHPGEKETPLPTE